MAKALNLHFRLLYLTVVLTSIVGVFGLERWAMNFHRDVGSLRAVVSLYTFAVMLMLTITLFLLNRNWFAKLLFSLLAAGTLLGVIFMPVTVLRSGGPAFLLLAPVTIAWSPSWWD